MRDTAREVRKNSYVMFVYEPLHMDVPVLADQQELTYNSYVQTQDVISRIYRKQWLLGTYEERERERERERVSGNRASRGISR